MSKKHQAEPQALQVEERRIYLLRRQKIMLDSDLAILYGVETKALNQAVKRNLKRFPPDFMFQLTKAEALALRSQTVTSNEKRGGRQYLPCAFTEQGVAMLSSVLRSEQAIQVNIAIMRTFVRIREMLATNRDLAQKVGAMEQKYDQQLRIIFEVLERLANDEEDLSSRTLGFSP